MAIKEDMGAPAAKEGSVDQDKIDRAVGAVVDLIVATLAGTGMGKFSEAARLCNIGQQLMRTRAKRVGDFAVLEVEEAEAKPRRNENANFNLNLGTVDERTARSEFMATFGGNAQIHAEAQRASIAAQEASELWTLREAQAGGDPNGVIAGRIQTLLRNMEVRNNAAQPGVVHTDVSRGHPAREGGPRADDAAGLRADANGAQGHGGVAFTRRIPETPEGLGG